MSIQFPWNKELGLEGTRSEMLEQLKALANPSCTRCYGRGYVHWKETEVKAANGKISIQKTYIICHKCVNKKEC